MGFTSPSVQKMYSCQGNKRWSAHAFAYHPVVTPQEALSWLVWAIPLPTDASSANSHPFPAVLCGTHQLWCFLYLIFPKGISSDWSKHCALISNVHARQKKGPNLGFLHGGCSVPDCECKDTSKNVLVVPEISLILKDSLAIKNWYPGQQASLQLYPCMCSSQAGFKTQLRKKKKYFECCSRDSVIKMA